MLELIKKVIEASVLTQFCFFFRIILMSFYSIKVGELYTCISSSTC